MLAIDGGPKTKTTPFGTGNPFGARERKEIGDVLASGDLFYFTGGKTEAFTRAAADYFGKRFCAAGSSGSAAVHAAVASLGIEPGAEVITSPITDLGSLIGILYQNLVPVFADLDPHTCNMTAETIERAVTPRTRAIIVVHLAGNPAEMDDILAMADRRGIPAIEDAAQAFNALHRGRKAGTMAPMGCFSTNFTKHMNTGEGGLVITDDEERYYTLHNFLDKFYDRHDRGVRLERLAPNYRITELQSAVGIAQLEKLDGITGRRSELGERLTRLVADVPGITPPLVHDHNSSSYWFYMFRVKPGGITVDRDRFAAALRAEGIPAKAGYIPRPVYCERAFTEKRFFPGGVWPAEVVAGRTYEYRRGLCPVAENILDTAVVLPMSEFFTDTDIDETAAAVLKVAEAYRKK